MCTILWNHETFMIVSFLLWGFSLAQIFPQPGLISLLGISFSHNEAENSSYFFHVMYEYGQIWKPEVTGVTGALYVCFKKRKQYFLTCDDSTDQPRDALHLSDIVVLKVCVAGGVELRTFAELLPQSSGDRHVVYDL